MPLVYILLGARGTGRRDVLVDLVDACLEDPDERVSVFLSTDDPRSPQDQRLEDLATVEVQQFTFDAETEELSMPPLTEGATTAFVVADGVADPVAQIEALLDWLHLRELQVGRVITVVNSQLAWKHPEAFPWFEACIHFSDAVLFHAREGVPNKWFKDFEQHFRKNCYPCHFDLVKKGKVKNPAMLLYPEPRRLSLVFDALDPENEPPLDVVIEGEDEDEEEELDPSEDPELDPYLQRNAAGQRAKRLPDISQFLD